MIVTVPSPTDGGYYDYYDPFDFLSFQDGNIQDFGAFSLFGPGPSQETSSSSISLGSSYDMATVVIPAACGDVRDTLIREYQSNHSPFRPNCSDFVYDPNWPDYGSYYSAGELISDQSTAAPNFSVLQGYAYATGLNNMSDNLNAGSTEHMPVNSGYRNPAAEIAIAQRYHQKAFMNSRHLAGDAVDITTRKADGSYDAEYWQALRAAAKAGNSNACVEPEDRVHFHGDWRTLTGTGANTPSGGNSFPSNRTTCPSGW